MIGLLLGLQIGYTKYMCFLCLWNRHSRADEAHYSTLEWPARINLTPGSFSAMHVPLVNSKNIFSTSSYQAWLDKKLRESYGSLR